MAPKAVQFIPTLAVASIPHAVKFYTEAIGFQLCERSGDAHAWLTVPSDNGQRLSIYLQKKDSLDSGARDMKVSMIDIRLDYGDGVLEALLSGFRTLGVVAVKSIEDGPFRVRSFRIQDLDGNMINFSQTLPDLNFKAPAGVNGYSSRK